MLNEGVRHQRAGQLVHAVTYYECAIELNPDYAEAYNNLGIASMTKGKFDEAMAHFDRAIAIKPDYAEAHFNRADIATFHQGDAGLEALEALAGIGGLYAYKDLHIPFALAKALEDSGDYARALEHLRKANALKRGQIDYDEANGLKLFRSVTAVFDSGLFDRFKGAGDPSSVPIFVLGMPRSGSTLIEQILASHPQIHGAGELQALPIAASAVLDAANRRVQYPECVPDLEDAALRRRPDRPILPASPRLRMARPA